MSFDFPHVGARREDAGQRFLRFVEQLEQAVSLLETQRVALQWMGLVALDNLAEGLLFRHLEQVFLASDEPTWVEHRTFSAPERRAARERFNKRVALAAEKLKSVMPVYFPDPILDTHDAVVFRVAHHYRNPIYHQDRHNPTLIHPVGRLYAQAVGRAFIRSHRWGLGIYSSPTFMKEIARLGWQGRGDVVFEPREAAEAIMSRICDPLTVDGAVLRSELADDIAYRCDVLDEDITSLRRDAYIDVGEFLIQVQDWAANRGDEEMLRLQKEHRELARQAEVAGASDQAIQVAMRDIERKQWDHLFGPNRQVRTRVDLQSHNKIRRKSERLRSWRSSEARLLERYQQLDDDLQLLEAAIDMMMRETDRRAWAEEDLARGR
jgi:hypothetical protein